MSAGVTAGAGLLKGVSEYEAGQTRGKLLRSNAGVAVAQSQSELEAGAYNESAVRLRGTAVQGQQVAQTGANNLQQAGTPNQVISSTAAITEMDALQTRNNAMRKAWGYQVQQVSDTFQSKQASKAGDFDAVGTILSGGAKGFGQANATGSWF